MRDFRNHFLAKLLTMISSLRPVVSRFISVISTQEPFIPCLVSRRWVRMRAGRVRKPAVATSVHKEESDDASYSFDQSSALSPALNDIWDDGIVPENRLGISERAATAEKISNQSADKEITKSDDLLLDRLSRCQHLEGMFQLVERHESIMNATHLLQVVSFLNSYLKSDPPTDGERKNLLSDRRMTSLLFRLIRSHRYISPQQILQVLNLCALLKVPQDARIVQVYLTLLKENLNELSVGDLAAAAFILDNFKGNRLAEALSIAVPMAFDMNITKQMETKNIKSLLHVLRFCWRFRPSYDSTHSIRLAMNNLIRNDIKTRNSLTFDQATDIFIVMERTGPPFWESIEHLLSIMERRAPNGFSKEKAARLLSSIQNLKAKYSDKFPPGHSVHKLEQSLKEIASPSSSRGSEDFVATEEPS